MPRILFLVVLLVVLVATLVAGGVYYLGRQMNQSASSTAKECKVAGCSGQVCAEAQKAEEIVTDCELKAEYACYKNARCELQMNGECGWRQDEALVKCLNDYIK